MWGALSDEKSGLQFSVFSGHRQRSLSQVWAPRDSKAYFPVSIFLDSPKPSGNLNTRKHDSEIGPVSETLRFLVIRTLDNGQSPETHWFWMILKITRFMDFVQWAIDWG
jgi:hypothetical protein